jgi:3-oxoacyl-[acyl-carrier protein] reductase
MRLEGRVALVTGAGSGIGRAIAQTFAAEGAAVVVNDLRLETAEETVKTLPGSGHLAVAADVSDSAAVAAMFERLDAVHDRLDILVNNAGVDRTPGDGHEKLLETGVQLPHMTDDGWQRMLAIHLDGAFFCTREASKRMTPHQSGSVINISSIAGLAGMGPVHYATAKGGILGFTRSLARELGRQKIRVNAICPGVIETPMSAQVPEAVLKGLEVATPLGRVGTAQEIATTALYFACDDSGFVTGQTLSPNGGLVIG